jgi:hypothetical protein
MIKKPETMRDRAHNLAQEAVIFGRLGGRTWDGLASLFVTFAEAEIARALSASGAGEEESAAIRLLREVYQTHRSPDHYEYEAEPCDWCRAVAPILAASATTTETKT